MTTEMPETPELARMMDQGFGGTPKDFSRYIALLDVLKVGAGASIVDFGCSWGYGSWQLAQSGYSVRAFEVSRRRASYAREQLAVDVVTDTSELGGGFDVFFSAHVLEHTPSASEAISLGLQVLRPGGWFVAVTPNGSLHYRTREPRSWRAAWGLKHPNHLDEQFYGQQFGSVPHMIMSAPYDLARLGEWVETPCQAVGGMEGWELLVIAKKKQPTR